VEISNAKRDRVTLVERRAGMIMIVTGGSGILSFFFSVYFRFDPFLFRMVSLDLFYLFYFFFLGFDSSEVEKRSRSTGNNIRSIEHLHCAVESRNKEVDNETKLHPRM
jgi:hypothetical protein